MRFSFDRGMWPEAALAAIATLAVAWPLTGLLRESVWVGPAVFMVLIVAVVGSLLRSLDLDPALIVLGQAFSVIVALIWRYLSDTLLWVVVPGPETLDRATSLLQEAGRTLQSYAAPAPTNEGVEFLIVSVLALTAVSVDAIGVTGRAPATAGIPLAAAFLVSVSNSGRAMEPWFFAAAALAWLLMVAQQGNRLVSGWSSADRRESVGSHDVAHGPSGHRTLARILAVVTVLGALVIASVVPHLPPTFFAEGLARDPEGRSVGGDAGQVSFTETMDVTADLNNQSQEPVLRYRSTSRPLQPLRVFANSSFDGRGWERPGFAPGPPRTSVLVPERGPEALRTDVPFETGEISVLSSALRAPNLATPSPLLEVRAEGVEMRWDEVTGSVRVEDRVESYTATFVQVAPRGGIPEDIGEVDADPQQWAEYLEVDPAAEESIAAIADGVVGGATNDLEVASLIQQYFRSGLFTYDLELAPGAASSGNPIGHFLETRQGYCVQFATAMVMMARHEGIPARMAQGFLPGELQANGSYTVIAADAHTWPELWIEGMGWTRFEPTPGIRTGPPPAYTELDTQVPEADPTLTNPEQPSVTPTQEPTGAAGEDQGWWSNLLDSLREAGPILLRALLVVVALGLLMSVVAIAGRRHREALLRQADTPQERIEGQWELLKRSLEDYGIDPPPDRSPREMGKHYVGKAHLDRPATDAIGRATATLERARYAPAARTEDTDDTTMHADVMRVLDSVAAKLPWNIRVSAKIFPRSGVHYIRSILRRWLP